MLRQPLLISLGLAVATSCGAAARPPAAIAPSFRLVASAEAPPNLTLSVGDGTVLRRDLMRAPTRRGLELSPDGAFYMYVIPGAMAAVLYVGRVGEAASPVGGINGAVWIGDHSVLLARGSRADWFRYEPDDQSFVAVLDNGIDDASLDAEELTGPTRQIEIADIAPRRDRVTFDVSQDGKAASPWLYDTRSGEVRQVLDNPTYERIILDDRGEVAFALGRDGEAPVLYEPVAGGWREVLGLPRKWRHVVAVVGPRVLLAIDAGTDEAAPHAPMALVEWDPTSHRVREVAPAGLDDLVIDREALRVLVHRDDATWTADDVRYAGVVTQLNALGITYVRDTAPTAWTAIADTPTHDRVYGIDLQRGVVTELTPPPPPAPPSGELITLTQTDGTNVQPLRARLFDAIGQAHGVIFFAPPIGDERVAPTWIHLLTSRGYHVVAAADEDTSWFIIDDEQLTWARARFGGLPIACVGVAYGAWHHDDDAPPPGPAALVTFSGMGGYAGPLPRQTEIPELAIGDQLATFMLDDLAQLDANREAFFSPERKAIYAAAPVASVQVNSSDLILPYDKLVAEFALLEGYLGQQLGGRVEPMPWDTLTNAGVGIRLGADKLAFLAGHPELVRQSLDAAARAAVASAFATLLQAIGNAYAAGPCPELQTRIAAISLPSALTAYRNSDEFEVIRNGWREQLRAIDRGRCRSEASVDAERRLLAPLWPR